ncbi:MAG TPA: peptidylprolyl isomerase, partial [Arenibaculum sp.]|nr:peptidylprolyl isomerase [Arenibaculum sp.]
MTLFAKRAIQTAALALSAVSFAAVAYAQSTQPATKPAAKAEDKKIAVFDKNSKIKREAGMYAVIETNHGTIVAKLMPETAPITVASFTELAKGTREWTDPKTGTKKKTPYFDGLIFHRVIDGFMIQGGDPTGTGTGGPGYSFKDEFDPKVVFDRPGRLAMANSGPNTNGSQFFITHVPTPHLNGKHTIFGQVVEGQDIVNAIGKIKKDASGRPA